MEGYNACVKAGVDTQIAPGKELLGTELSDPAYYASKRIPTIHYTMGGLCITTDAQVCTEAGEPIPNLFACGEVTGGVQGGNRLGGNSFTDLIVFVQGRRPSPVRRYFPEAARESFSRASSDCSATVRSASSRM